MNFPEVADLVLPEEGVFHNLVFVRRRKTYPMQVSKVLSDGQRGTASGTCGGQRALKFPTWRFRYQRRSPRDSVPGQAGATGYPSR